MKGVKIWLNIQASTNALERVLNWLKNNMNSKFRKEVMYAGIAAVAYQVWQGRNKVYMYWYQYSPSIDWSLKQIKHFVRARIGAILPKKISRANFNWFLQL